MRRERRERVRGERKDRRERVGRRGGGEGKEREKGWGERREKARQEREGAEYVAAADTRHVDLDPHIRERGERGDRPVLECHPLDRLQHEARVLRDVSQRLAVDDRERWSRKGIRRGHLAE